MKIVLTDELIDLIDARDEMFLESFATMDSHIDVKLFNNINQDIAARIVGLVKTKRIMQKIEEEVESGNVGSSTD